MLAQSSDAAFWLDARRAAGRGLGVCSATCAPCASPTSRCWRCWSSTHLVGAATLPFATWAWAWLHFAVILTIGFVLSLTGGFGAGDAKFAAAMAPFVALGDARLFLALLAAVAIAGFVTHRLARRVALVRAQTPGWISWQRREFPMGLALGPALIFYLALASIYGS
jgi:prepilin peptidase CpaA